LKESEQKKWQLIQQVQARYQKGVRKSDLSREFSIDRKTVHKYLQLKETFRHDRKGHHSADPYQKTILCLLKQNVTTNYIFHVIRKQGYEKSLSTLRDYILKLRKKENIHKERNRSSSCRDSGFMLTYGPNHPVALKKKRLFKK
jgi:transposase